MAGADYSDLLWDLAGNNVEDGYSKKPNVPTFLDATGIALAKCKVSLVSNQHGTLFSCFMHQGRTEVSSHGWTIHARNIPGAADGRELHGVMGIAIPDNTERVMDSAVVFLSSYGHPDEKTLRSLWLFAKARIDVVMKHEHKKGKFLDLCYDHHWPMENSIAREKERGME